MSEDNENTEVRTPVEECLCAVLAESYYIDGGTPEEFKELIEKDPVLSKMYDKRPYFFRARRSASEEESQESTEVCF